MAEKLDENKVESDDLASDPTFVVYCDGSIKK